MSHFYLYLFLILVIYFFNNLATFFNPGIFFPICRYNLIEIKPIKTLIYCGYRTREKLKFQLAHQPSKLHELLA